MAFAAGHIGATLVVAAGLAAAVRLGWMSVSVAHAPDVGMSYGAMAVLGALTTAIPLRWRPAWAGWWLAVGAVVIALGRDFTDVGHTVAMVLGMAVATRFGEPRRWTPPRRVLLGVGAAFAYAVLADSVDALVPVTAAGAVGALIGGCAHLLRRSVPRVDVRVG